ncbi:hypothetical protein C8Q75DRAFT_893417 [Abortiporus biennis]|nr:hypothetical protein C8Q75DRAFT_893417 [Abortiporus biennis]
MTEDANHSTGQVQVTPGKRVRFRSASSCDQYNSEDPTPVKKLKTMESNKPTEKPTQSVQVSPDSGRFNDTASKVTAEIDDLPVAWKEKKHIVSSVPTKEEKSNSSPDSHSHDIEEAFNPIAPTAEAEGKEITDLADSSGEQNEDEEGEEYREDEEDEEDEEDDEEAEGSDDEESNDVCVLTTSYGGSLDFDIIHAGGASKPRRGPFNRFVRI